MLETIRKRWEHMAAMPKALLCITGILIGGYFLFQMGVFIGETIYLALNN